MYLNARLTEGLKWIFTRSSQKDLYKIMQGPLKEGFVKKIFSQGHKGFVRACAVEMAMGHGHLTRVISCENSKGPCHSPGPRQLHDRCM